MGRHYALRTVSTSRQKPAMLRKTALSTPAMLCWLGFACLLTACSGGSKQPLDIGAHRGTLVVPTGWSVVNQGEKWEVRQGEASIVLHDLGPVSPQAMQREAERTIALWRGGNAEGAQTRVKRLMANVNRYVAEPSRIPLVNTMLPLIESGAQNLPEDELSQRFADWQQALRDMPTPSLASLGDGALTISGHDRRRAIHSSEQRTVGGKPAIEYMTVTQSTQSNKKRIVAIDNDGQLFAVYFGVLGHEAHLDTLDRVVRSLHFDAAASERR